jgi:hypothetical protein
LVPHTNTAFLLLFAIISPQSVTGKLTQSAFHNRLEVKMRRLYLLLAVVGAVVPYYFFISFLLENGLDIGLMIDQLFANDISTFFAVDLLITAVVFLIYSHSDARRFQIANWWAYALATLLVGPSFSFPLFLYSRESRLEPGD